MRLRKHGDPETVLSYLKHRQHWTCTVEVCKREYSARGLCSKHLHIEYRKEVKEEVFTAYGHKRQCCGESRTEFLAVDPINGGGLKHHRELGGKHGVQFYCWLKKQSYSKDNYCLLCHNCNQSLGHYGYCPHEKHQL